jgi:hypothetical protein
MLKKKLLIFVLIFSKVEVLKSFDYKILLPTFGILASGSGYLLKKNANKLIKNKNSVKYKNIIKYLVPVLYFGSVLSISTWIYLLIRDKNLELEI